MISKGLRFANGDYYIFLQRGGKLTVSMSPSGRAKAVDFLLKDKGVRVTLTIGSVKGGDTVSLKTKGSIQTLEVESNQHSIFSRNAKIIGCYGIVSIFSDKTDSIMSQNVIIVDNVEYATIKAMASKTMQTYESMFVNKVILRRYASLLPAYIGGGFSDDELDTLSEVREGSRVDIDEPEPAKKQIDPLSENKKSNNTDPVKTKLVLESEPTSNISVNDFNPLWTNASKEQKKIIKPLFTGVPALSQDELNSRYKKVLKALNEN